MDGAIQYVVILNPRLSATAMMLFWDIHADRAVRSVLVFKTYMLQLSHIMKFGFNN